MKVKIIGEFEGRRIILKYNCMRIYCATTEFEVISKIIKKTIQTLRKIHQEFTWLLM